MKLQKIEIENFRCFESLAIDFDDDVNVIVGVNGAGKTALLDAIAIGLCDLTFTPFDKREWRYIYNASGKRFHYNQESERGVLLSVDDIHVPAFANDVFIERKDYVCITTIASTDDNSKRLTWKQRYDYNKHKTNSSFGYTSESNDIHNYIDTKWTTAQKDKFSCIDVPAYYRAQRRFSQTPELGNIFQVKIERPLALQNAMDAGADYNAVCQWFYVRENAELRERAKTSNVFEYSDLKSVRKAIKSTIEGVERIYFDESTPPRFMVEINRNNTVTNLAIDQLSDGYRNLLAIIIDFARRLAVANPYIENPLEVPGILLIDEMELHLHPKWQQTIIPSLRKVFPNTQLIVTTHSPQVLTTVDHRCIRILKDNNVYSVTESTKGAEAKRMLENILGTESRPPDSEIGKKIKTIYDLIHEDKLDKAQQEINNLGSINERIKIDEPAIIEAESLITCKRWEKENGL
jgi:predicted ATP-binding protein involved in virulence